MYHTLFFSHRPLVPSAVNAICTVAPSATVVPSAAAATAVCSVRNTTRTRSHDIIANNQCSSSSTHTRRAESWFRNTGGGPQKNSLYASLSDKPEHKTTHRVYSCCLAVFAPLSPAVTIVVRFVLSVLRLSVPRATQPTEKKLSLQIKKCFAQQPTPGRGKTFYVVQQSTNDLQNAPPPPPGRAATRDRQTPYMLYTIQRRTEGER